MKQLLLRGALLTLLMVGLLVYARPSQAEPMYYYVNHYHFRYSQDIGDHYASNGCTYDIIRSFYDLWYHEYSRFTDQWTGREYYQSTGHYGDSYQNPRNCPIIGLHEE